jgi:uncharacterized membrane protein SpoIIM required for sporulation
VTATAESAAPTLRSAAFRKGREAAWRRLEVIVERAETKGVERLTTQELSELPLLYRTAASSLSVARAIALDRNLILYLENLALRAYFLVYGPRGGFFATLAEFFRRGFPRAVRAAARPIAISFLAVAIGVAVGYAITVHNESILTRLVPEGLAGDRGASSTTADLRDHEIFAPWPGFAQSFIVFANALFRHNATISIMIFGFGVFAGVPTLLLLAYQGVTYGGFLALHHNRGLTLDFIGWTAIHGVTEFGAIILAGAGGLVIAELMLFPGRYSRLENLARNGIAAAEIAGGAVCMLFVAGVIEGGLRQLISDTPARLVFGLATGVVWLCYFLLAGRSDGAGT